MKAFIILIVTGLSFVLTSVGANATPITKDIANAYYQNCLAQDTPMMGNDAKDLMCACTASKMMDTMSIEDIQATSSPDTNVARPAANKILLNVYAPCIEFPARDYHYLTCMESPDTKQISKQPQALCACMSDSVALFLRNNADEVFRDILTRNPFILDPMEALTKDESFKQFAHSELLACYAKNR